MSKLSLGDARAYYLSTAKNELGVVSAQSIAGTKGCKMQFIDTNTWNCSYYSRFG
jgi:exosome complex RNA-binding protein Csl4